MVTTVERVSCYALIALAASKEVIVVGEAILSAMHPRGEKFLTMICDNGKDYAHYFLFAYLLDANFAHLHNSWERGLNENTDGFIRHYFRKGSALRT